MDDSRLTGSAMTRAAILLGAVFAVAMAAVFAIRFIYGHGGLDSANEPFGYDFSAFYAAAQLALQGRPELAFDAEALRRAVQDFAPGYTGSLPYFYPPALFLLLTPFGLLPYVPAYLAFEVFTGAAALFAAAHLVRGRALLAAALFPPALINLFQGQNGFLTAALFGGGLLALQCRPVLAGVLFGLLTLKPQLGVLIPIALLAGGCWRAFAAAAITALTLWLAAYVAYGPETYLAFADGMRAAAARYSAEGKLPILQMSSVSTAFLLLGAPVTVAGAAQIAASLAAAGLVADGWRRRAAPFAPKAALLIGAALLATPYVFRYDLVVLGFAIAWLWQDGEARGFAKYERLVLALLWLAPAVTEALAKTIHLQLGPVAFAALAFMAHRRLRAPAVAAA